jgi:hypothetical protein
MATNIYNYDGTLRTTIPDNAIDSTTSINMPGRGFINYGEDVNQDLLWIMQNFANATAPTNPVTGQIWYNTATNSIYIYNGTSWLSAGGAVISGTAPTGQNPGTLWYNSIKQQLNVWSGTAWLLVGPLGSPTGYINDPNITSGLPNYSAWTAIQISDGVNSHAAWALNVGSVLLYIVSAATTSYNPIPAISGFPTIYPGITFNTAIPASVGTSGYSGYSGFGTSGSSGYSGYSGIATSGYSGYSGAAATNARINLTSDTTFYVNGGTGSDITGNGTVGSPWASPQYAANFIQRNYDTHGYIVTISISAGNYGSLFIAGPLVGQTAASTFVISGAGSTTVLGAVSPGYAAIEVSQNARCTVENLKVVNANATPGYLGSGNGLAASGGGLIVIGNGIELGACGISQIYSGTNGTVLTNVNISPTITISGGGDIAFYCEASSLLSLDAATITFSTAVTYSVVTAFSDQLGRMDMINTTFGGAVVTGRRYEVGSLAIINTLGTTTIPGTIDGITSSLGVYT